MRVDGTFDGVHLGFGMSVRFTGLQTRKRDDVPLAVSPWAKGEIDRQPDICIAVGEKPLDSGWHDADHCTRFTLNRQNLADRVRAAVEAALPIVVTQNDCAYVLGQNIGAP